MYKFLFGPVPSLKLGISPDIDLVPHKICSLNCICCEYGRRSKLITKRKEYVVLAEVIKKIADFSSKKTASNKHTYKNNSKKISREYN